MNEAEQKETVDELLASRHAVYGDRIDNMERVAQIWSGLLGVEIKDWQVPLLMSAYKMFRTFQTPNYSDNSDDIDGWKKMFVEVMDANHGGIVQARTVEEYELKLGTRKVDDLIVPLSHTIASEAQANFHSDMPRHPYANVQRDEDAEQDEVVHATGYTPARESLNEALNMDAWLRNRCGQPIGVSRCGLHADHHGDCVGTL